MPQDQRPTVSVAESERRLRLLDEVARETRAMAGPDEIMQATARLLGRHLAANRCAYAEVAADQDHFDLTGDYNDGVASIVGHYAFSQFGAEVTRLMRADQPYVNCDVDTDPRTAGTDLSAYRQTQIQAVICVPLHKDGRFVAAMAVHQKVPRQWTADEIDLVQMVVASCWESLNRARADKALRDAHQRLSLAMSAGELGDWSWTAATDEVVLGDRAADMYGLPRNRPLARQSIRDLIHPDEQAEAAANAQKSFQEKGLYSMRYRVHPADGSAMRWLFVQGKPLYAADGSVTGMSGVVEDITAQRATQDAARNEAEMLEILNQTGSALAAQLDLNELLQHATDAATRLTGAQFGAFFYNGTDEQGDAYLLYTLSGAPKEAFERFGHPRPTALFGPTFQGEAPIRVDDVLADPRYGRWAPHYGMPPGHLPVRSYLAVAVTSRSGAVIGGLFFGHPEPGRFTARSERLAVGIAGQAAVAVDNARLYAQAQRDADEKRALLDSERAARQDAERASAIKDQFLATLSHELRTPLGAILGWAHILRRKIDAADADLHKGIDVIERSTRVQTQLIDDLLDMSRITSGKLRLDVQPVAPIAFIEAAVETLRPTAEASQVRIETMLDPLAGPVSGDPGRLQQIVWNLLANAVKFTPKGGKVQVLLERVNSHVEISIADTGVGIRPDVLPYIFERFRQGDGSITRRFGGLGLGLSIVKHLVELHGGGVMAKSPGEGQGSTFVVHLPVKAVHAGDPSSRVHPEDPTPPRAAFNPDELHGIKVLVVDDEPDSRDLLRRVLEDSGALVLEAGDAQAALAAIQDHTPHVLVSDIGMPEVDGYELLRLVRKLGAARGGSLPAIALTAFARSEDRIRALRAGFAVHVSKPVEPSEIVATVASVAGRTGGGPAA